jgi:hypothetical protein
MACDPLPRPVAVRRGPVALAAPADEPTADEADGWPLEGDGEPAPRRVRRERPYVSRAERGPRARPAHIQRLSKQRLVRDAEAYPPSINAEHPRPRTFGECEASALGAPSNPCPFVSCRWNLYLDVDPTTGSVKLNHPDREVWQLAQTCALRVAAGGGRTLEEVGDLTNLSRERIRQLEDRMLGRLRARSALWAVDAPEAVPAWEWRGQRGRWEANR